MHKYDAGFVGASDTTLGYNPKEQMPDSAYPRLTTIQRRINSLNERIGETCVTIGSNLDRISGPVPVDEPIKESAMSLDQSTLGQIENGITALELQVIALAQEVNRLNGL